MLIGSIASRMMSSACFFSWALRLTERMVTGARLTLRPNESHFASSAFNPGYLEPFSDHSTHSASPRSVPSVSWWSAMPTLSHVR